MSATPGDVQAKIKDAEDDIKLATSSPAKMVAAHGADPSGWPDGHLKTGFLGLEAARAEAGQLVAPPAPVPPPPPPPSPSPSPGTAKDDKRAYKCSQISMQGWSYANPAPGVHNLVGSYNGGPAPGPDFTFLDFTNDDVWVETDPHYGKVWHFRCGPHSHNPFVDHVQTLGFWYWDHNSNLSFRRPVYTDQGAASWDWYAYAIKCDAGWTSNDLPPGSLFMEVGYPHIASPPIEIGLHGNNLGVTRSAGLWSGNYPWPEYTYKNIRTYSSELAGRWLEMLVGVYWSSHKNGQLIVKTRIPELGETSFRTDLALTGIDTWQWSSSVPQDSGPGGFAHCDDIFGPYEQWASTKQYHDGTFPEHNYKLYGWVRCATEADARSFLPA